MSERFVAHLNDLELKQSEDFPWSKEVVTKGGKVVCRQELTIVANGCFDLLHPGHLNLFGWLDTLSYRKGLRPIVAINSDESVRRLKGSGRPVWPEQARAAYITHLKWPFTVIIFDEDTPQRLMDMLRPAAVLKGGDYDPSTVIRSYGAEVITVPLADGWSTSRIIGDTR